MLKHTKLISIHIISDFNLIANMMVLQQNKNINSTARSVVWLPLDLLRLQGPGVGIVEILLAELSVCRTIMAPLFASVAAWYQRRWEN